MKQLFLLVVQRILAVDSKMPERMMRAGPSLFAFSRLPLRTSTLAQPPPEELELHDIQFQLCEFDKYPHWSFVRPFSAASFIAWPA
jgi:hypothetical protein